MARRFILKFTFFLTSLLMLIALSVLPVAYHLGEAIPVHAVVEQQNTSTTPIIYEPAWGKDDPLSPLQYKIMAEMYRHAAVLVLGSSRSRHFRNALVITSENDFYNLSIAGATEQEYLALFNTLLQQGETPAIVILGLDLFRFNTPSIPNSRAYWEQDTVPLDWNYLTQLEAATKRTFQELLGGNYITLSQRVYEDGVIYWGYNALLNRIGYLPDGSVLVPKNRPPLEETRTYKAFQTRTAWYSPGDGTTIYQPALEDVEQIAALAAEHDIALYPVILPFYPEVADALLTDPDYAYVAPTIQATDDIVTRYGYKLYNFIDPRPLGGDESDFFDTHHFGERLSLLIYTELVRDNPDVFAPYSDLATLERYIAEAEDPFYVFPLSRGQ